MSRSNWLPASETYRRLAALPTTIIVVLALLGGVWVFVVHPCCVEFAGGYRNQGEESDRRTEYESGCSDDNEWPVFFDREYVEANPPDKDTEERKTSCEDLKAQRRMAVAAERLAVLTCHQFWLAALGTSAVLAALYFTIRATREAVEGNKIARQSFIADQRPWIELVSVKPDGHLIFEAPPSVEYGHLAIVLHIKNAGKNPALRIRVDAKLTMSNLENLISQQRQMADQIKKSFIAAKNNPATVVFEHSLFPGRELQTVRTTAWMDTSDLLRFRQWEEKAPNPIALVGLIGCITYESPVDSDLHQTAIIRDVRHVYGVGGILGAIRLRGHYAQNSLVIGKSDVGTGPID